MIARLMLAAAFSPWPAAGWATAPAAPREAPVPEAVQDAPADPEDEFHPEDYPVVALADMSVKEPCRKQKGSFEVKDRLFSSDFSFTGAVRKTPPRRWELIRRWADGLGDPEAAERYGNEVSVAFGKGTVWLSVPEGLLPILQSNLQPGDRALGYLVLVGCADLRPVFAIDEFDTYDPDAEEDGDVVTQAPLDPDDGVRESRPVLASAGSGVRADARTGKILEGCRNGRTGPT